MLSVEAFAARLVDTLVSGGAVVGEMQLQSLGLSLQLVILLQLLLIVLILIAVLLVIIFFPLRLFLQETGHCDSCFHRCAKLAQVHVLPLPRERSFEAIADFGNAVVAGRVPL